MQIHKVPDELKTLWNMGLVHITTHNLKRGVGDLRNSTKYQKNMLAHAAGGSYLVLRPPPPLTLAAMI
jgi:hypothetical protein